METNTFESGNMKITKEFQIVLVIFSIFNEPSDTFAGNLHIMPL